MTKQVTKKASDVKRPRGAPAGNDNYSRGAVFNDALRRSIAQDDGRRLRLAAEKLLSLAADGIPWAVRELADRTDGRAFQAVSLSGADGGPIKITGTIKLVRPE